MPRGVPLVVDVLLLEALEDRSEPLIAREGVLKVVLLRDLDRGLFGVGERLGDWVVVEKLVVCKLCRRLSNDSLCGRYKGGRQGRGISTPQSSGGKEETASWQLTFSSIDTLVTTIYGHCEMQTD